MRRWPDPPWRTARLAEYHVRENLAAGRLVAVLDEELVDTEAFHILYTGRERTRAACAPSSTS